jgi:ribosomal protein L11 methyltransferase
VEVAVHVDSPEVAGRTAVGDLGALDLRCEGVEDRDWLAAHREQSVAFPVGRSLWVDPRPDAPTPAPDGRLRLAVEPRSAFGSGSHESTQMLLLELEERDLTDAAVLDVGSGSGILALAADALGAARVVGVELDVDAVWVARETALVQKWTPRVQFVAGTADSLAGVRFNLILCNMISSLMLPLLDDLERLLDPMGGLALSGLLADETDEVAAEIARHGLRVTGSMKLGEWACLRVCHA